jgi:NADH dehydrogenase [ubiquinone] 1 alpha subcomplex assembly factor 5
MTSQPHIFDRALLTQRRNRAAPHARDHDYLLRYVAEDIADRLALIRRSFPIALNLGAHTGVVSRRLRQLDRIGIMIDSDPSAAMLALCDGPRLGADEELLPFGPATLDLVVSGLALHLVNDLPGALIQIRHALRGDGLLLATLLGTGTLAELSEALLLAETETEGGAAPRIAPFADVRALGGLLQRAGFALPVADADTLQVTYPDAITLMRDLRGMGMTNALVAAYRKPLTRRALARTCEIYAGRHPGPKGGIIATFELVTLTGWAPDPSQPKPLRPGSATTRLADALGVPEGTHNFGKMESP